jgi:hypothetical protein
MLRLLSFCLIFLSVFVAHAAVRGDNILYVGGTWQALKEKTNGKLDLDSKDKATFTSKNGNFDIPYNSIGSIEYGQKAGRRVGVALAVSPVALLSKKRRHFVSVEYLDGQGTKQGVVFEVGKGQFAEVLSTFSTRSGKAVEFESDEARKIYEKEAK